MKKIIISGLILIMVIAGIFVLRNSNTGGNVIKEDVKEITLQASRFQYSPDTVTVNKGDKVIITIENLDTMHGIRIPDFNVRGEEGVEFIADKTGEFEFYCAVFCGDNHKEMKGKLIIK